MKFIPKKAQSEVEIYRNYLLKGNALKIDGGGHDQIDVIPREEINSMNSRENVGCEEYTKLGRFSDQFFTAIESLKNEGYVVVKKFCEYSGCCQYAAYIYYLA